MVKYVVLVASVMLMFLPAMADHKGGHTGKGDGATDSMTPGMTGTNPGISKKGGNIPGLSGGGGDSGSGKGGGGGGGKN